MLKKCTFVLAIVFAFFQFNSFAQEAEISAQIPNTKIEFDEPKFDFGNIPQDQPVFHDFYFTNVGNHTLIISDVKASCGCTILEWPDFPIEAGGRGIIKVKFDPKYKRGDQNKYITVFGNIEPEPTRANILAYVEYEETEPIVSAPKNTTIYFDKMIHDFGTVKQGDKLNYAFEFTNIGTEVLKIKSVKYQCNCLDVSWDKDEYKSGEKGKILVNFDTNKKEKHQHQSLQLIGNLNNPIEISLLAYVQKKRQNGSNSDDLINTSYGNNDGLAISLSPNPAKNSIQLMFDEVAIQGDGLIEIFDANGKLVYTQAIGLVFENTSKTINLSNYNSGIYIMKIKVGEKTTFSKFVKAKF